MPIPLFEILRRWSVSDLAELLDPGTSEILMEERPLGDADPWCEVAGKFSLASRVWVPFDRSSLGPRQPVRITGRAVEQDCELVLLKAAPHVTIQSGASRARIFVGRYGYAFHAHVNLWRAATLLVGDGATSNGARIVVDQAQVTIGRDCMFSDQVVLQSNDQHGIVEVATGAFVNSGPAEIVVGEHVWLGRRAMLLPNARIGPGSIVAAGAVVTGEIPANSIAAGVPARTLRSGVTWSREPERLDAASREYLARARAAG